MIKLDSIYKSYMLAETEVPVLFEISLEVQQAEFTAIMGASGSGKTTLMNIIGCLDKPTQGTYTLNGIDVMCLSEKGQALVRNKHIGFVFQQFHLLPRLTAIQNVELALIYGGINKKERFQRSLAILNKVGLADRANHLPNQLSGGQKQRVAIARALVTNPDFILADEPTGALDSVSGSQIIEIFSQLNQEGKTIIMVTHEREVAAFAKRIILIRDGRIIQSRGEIV